MYIGAVLREGIFAGDQLKENSFVVLTIVNPFYSLWAEVLGAVRINRLITENLENCLRLIKLFIFVERVMWMNR